MGVRVDWRVVVALVAAVTCVGLSGCAGASSRRPIEGPVAAVMAGKGQIILVDLDDARIIESVAMRSWTGDIAADPGSGTFVTSQCGGVGDEADNKLGIIDVRHGGPVGYVTLPRRNPLGVEVVGKGRVIVDHGWEEREGLFACVVDTSKREVVQQGRIPGNNEPVVAAAGVAWASSVNALTDETSLRRVDKDSLQSEAVVRGGEYASVQCADASGLAGWLRPRNQAPVLARFDAVTGAVEATTSVAFADGAGRLVAVGGRLVAVDFSGNDMNRPGKQLIVFDGATLRRERTIPVVGGPTDAAVWRDRVVVVNRLDLTLQVIDAATGAVDATVSLPAKLRLPMQLAILDGGG